MLNCYSTHKDPVLITLLSADSLPVWLNTQPSIIKNWIQQNGFTANPDTVCLIPSPEGKIMQVLAGCKNPDDFWAVGALPRLLPPGDYTINPLSTQMALAWGLGAYQFDRYKKLEPSTARLFILEPEKISKHIQAFYLVRDLINTPAENMGPAELAGVADTLDATSVRHIVGDELLVQNYPAIHTVGRASQQAPRLIDLRWGNPKHPKVTLVGKGVCFDSGGLDIKSASNMQMMKKDMGGAAHVLGLTQLIITNQLPVSLRVLVPAVENSISGNAYRPGDVIKTRKGLTVEIGNTDAEGRLVLADVLTEASSEFPDLIIDFATLTGAARVALGTDVPAFFTDNHHLSAQLMQCAESEQDPLWQLPLYTPYRCLLDSKIADINNAGNSGYAGAITAALFLKEFVPADVNWIHVDLMAWNLTSRPGRPEGGEVMGLRAIYKLLRDKYT
ncbi:MAG: leucyl aminopeptidase family protein [Gammaproteobacteria bacterium]